LNHYCLCSFLFGVAIICKSHQSTRLRSHGVNLRMAPVSDSPSRLNSKGAVGKSSASSSTGGPGGDGGNPGWWCPLSSVLEVDVCRTGTLPFDPPVASYLEEALIGLIGGAGDTRPKRDETAWRKVGALDKLLRGIAAAAVCKSLFWITLGVIFQRIQEPVLASLRRELSASWHLLALAMVQQSPKDAKDWVQAAMPYVIAQAIYRLIHDAFESDRKVTTAQANVLIDKLTLIIHFEVTGFQLNLQTVHKARHRIFLRRVWKSPYVNQRELMKGFQRQEKLENNAASNGNRPLAFAQSQSDVASYVSENRPLEEVQLHYIMQGRAALLRQGRSKAYSRSLMSASGSDSALLAGSRSSMGVAFSGSSADMTSWAAAESTCSPPPAELSVDRYEGLADDGAAMLQKHLAALQSFEDDASEDEVDDANGDAENEDVEESPDGGEELSDIDDPSGATQELATPFLGSPKPVMDAWSPIVASPAGGVAGSVAVGLASVESDAAGTDSQIPSPQKRRLHFRSSLVAGKRGSVVKEMSEEAKSKQMRIKQEALLKLIVGCPLPEELCRKELHTGWVSPAVLRLAPDCQENHHLLNKPSTEAFSLKMATRPAKAQSLSTPALRRLQKQDKDRQKQDKDDEDRPRSRAQTAQSVSERSLKDDGSAAGSGALGRTGSHGRPASHNGKARHNDTDGSGFPFYGSGQVTGSPPIDSTVGSGVIRGSANHHKVEGVTFIVGAPKNMSGSHILQRLEEQQKAFRRGTFAEYVKEFDILTGSRKVALEEGRLKDEEAAYLRKMDRLVGGKPKRMIPMSKFKMGRG